MNPPAPPPAMASNSLNHVGPLGPVLFRLRSKNAWLVLSINGRPGADANFRAQGAGCFPGLSKSLNLGNPGGVPTWRKTATARGLYVLPSGDAEAMQRPGGVALSTRQSIKRPVTACREPTLRHHLASIPADPGDRWKARMVGEPRVDVVIMAVAPRHSSRWWIQAGRERTCARISAPEILMGIVFQSC